MSLQWHKLLLRGWLCSALKTKCILHLRENTVTAAGRFEHSVFLSLALVQNHALEKKEKKKKGSWKGWTSGNHTDAREWISQSSSRSSEKLKKPNPIFSSVPSLRLQPWPQARRALLVTLALALVNHIVHQALVVAQRPDGKWRSLLRRDRKRLFASLPVVSDGVFRDQGSLWVHAPCEGLVCVEVSVDTDLFPLPQQVCVDKRVLNRGVLVFIVVLACFWETVLSRQEDGAVWIVDGNLLTQLLLLLPVRKDRRDKERLINRTSYS